MDLPTIIVSVITSGITSTIIGFWLNAEKSRKEFLRDKLEQLFVAERLFSNVIKVYVWLPNILFLTGKGPFHDPKDMEKAPEGSQRARETFEMLASLYFPEFLPTWSELAKSLRKFNRVVLSINRGDDAESRIRTAQALDEAMKVFQQKQKSARTSADFESTRIYSATLVGSANPSCSAACLNTRRSELMMTTCVGAAS